MTEQKKNGYQPIIGIIVALGLAWFFFGGGLEKQAAKNMADIHSQVASDAVQQYEIAKRQGDRIQICVQAGLVSAAYLQAKDEPNYQRWKQTESEDCKLAGIAR